MLFHFLICSSLMDGSSLLSMRDQDLHLLPCRTITQLVDMAIIMDLRMAGITCELISARHDWDILHLLKGEFFMNHGTSMV